MWLLPADKIDFVMTGNLLHTFDNVKNGVPTVIVADICSPADSDRSWPGRHIRVHAPSRCALVHRQGSAGAPHWWQKEPAMRFSAAIRTLPQVLATPIRRQPEPPAPVLPELDEEAAADLMRDALPELDQRVRQSGEW